MSIGLSGCLAGGTVVGPAERDFGTAPAEISYNPATEIVTLTASGVTQPALTRLAMSDVPGSKTYRASSTDQWALIKESASGKTYAYVAGGDGNGVGAAISGVEYGSRGDTELPAGGSAKFNGSYNGLFQQRSNQNVVYLTSGDATLNANFDAGTISGKVSNRAFHNLVNGNQIGGTALYDFVLDPTSIGGTGEFSGTVTGGYVIDGSASAGSNGAFAGLIGGASGNEVAGAVSMDYTQGAFNHKEVGGFVAKK